MGDPSHWLRLLALREVIQEGIKWVDAVVDRVRAKSIQQVKWSTREIDASKKLNILIF